jgi:peptidoglycan/xylan/chitin deacetylase (PgdA/CDA1 family)
MPPPFRVVFFGATSCALALTAYSVIRQPPPLEIALACFLAYGALVTTGILLLPMRMFADAVLRGPKSARGIALTFDDGPDPASTPKILDALDARDAKATFFVIAKKAEAHPDLVREIVRRGHAVALHSYAHDRLFSLRGAKAVRADLERGVATLEALTGTRPYWFRPPIGHTNPTIVRICDELDLRIIGWSVSARDGTARAREASCLARVRAGLREGAIVLLHDAAERDDYEPLGPKLVPKVLEAAAAENLTVVPLSSWVPALPD